MKHLLFLLLFVQPAVWTLAQGGGMSVYQKAKTSPLRIQFRSEEAQNKIGASFYYGEPGFVQSKEYAALWFCELAKEKYTLAQYNLAVCYYFGEGVVQNKDSAAYLFRAAAKSGVTEAQYNLSLCYFFGEGMKRDSAQAVSWYKKATKKKKDLSEMQNWRAEAKQYEGNPGHLYKRVIEKDTPLMESEWAENALGESFFKGESHFPQNAEKAMYWFRKSAKRSYGKAFSNLGYCFFFGDGIPQNKDSAVHYFRLAAEKGIVAAQCNLALCYFFGDGIEKNNDSVAYWYLKAARTNTPLACNNLGYCYELGIGVAQNSKKAEAYYKIAAEEGYPPAQFNLAALYAEESTSNDRKKTLGWLQQAANQGYPPALEAIKAMKEGKTDFTVSPLKGKLVRYGLEKIQQDH